jgi:hypothetical protein
MRAVQGCLAAALLVLVAGPLQAQQSLACDVDADQDIDRVDITMIATARNQAADNSLDPRDPDRDLLITVNDARICTQRCSLNQCASPPANRRPTADAGSDQAVFPGMTVTLNGSASSDPDGDALTYRWTLRIRPNGSAATLGSAAAVMPQFVADMEGIYEVELVVNDGRIDSVVDTVVVTTVPNNTPPVANAGSDQDPIVKCNWAISFYWTAACRAMSTAMH